MGQNWTPMVGQYSMPINSSEILQFLEKAVSGTPEPVVLKSFDEAVMAKKAALNCLTCADWDLHHGSCVNSNWGSHWLAVISSEVAALLSIGRNID